MANRKPYDLKYFMIFYNLFQVIACLALIKQLLNSGWSFRLLYSCEVTDFSYNSKAIGMMHGAYYNYMLKAVELVETLLFALRKKQNQISFLHVYHHVFTYAIAWIFAKYVGGMKNKQTRH